MRAVVADGPGDPSVLQVGTRPDPEPGPGQLLVAVSHAGVNFADVVMRQGVSGMPFPLVPGVEGAGVVIAAGDGVDEVVVGDRVAWSPVKESSSVGSYAALAVVGAAQAVPVPDDIPLETAAGAILQGLTAHYLATEIHPLGPGVTALVHAGAGGTGRLVVQWAKHLGAEVFVTVGSEAKAAVAREAGADHAIVYTEQDFVEEVLDRTGGRGVDYVVDGVGAGTFRGDLRVVAERGSICVLGRAAGVPEQFSPLELIAKSASVTGGYMTNFLRDRAEVLRKADDVWRAITDGWLVPLLHDVLPLEDAAEAHRRLEGRKTVGKLVLDAAGD